MQVGDNISFAARANKLKTVGASKIAREKIQANATLKGGLSKDDYWKSRVFSGADVEQFYKLYYPQYPDELCRALAVRIQEIVYMGKGDDRKKPYLRQFDKNGCEVKDERVWDLERELEEARMEGLIKLTQQRLEEMLKSEQ